MVSVSLSRRDLVLTVVTADGEVVDFNKPKGASPAPAIALAPPAQPRSPAIAATPTPPPRAPSATDSTRTEEPAKSAEEIKSAFVKQVAENMRQKLEDEKKQKETSAADQKAEAEAKQKADDETTAKAAQEAKDNEEAEAAEKAKVDAEEKKRLEDEEMERMIAEMEEEERKREEDEKRYAEEKKRKDEETKSKVAERVKEEEERLRKLEREAEEAEAAREAESPEQKAEREASNKALFAGLSKNTQFGPGANATDDDASGDSTPAEVVEPEESTVPAPAPAKSTSAPKSKPANLIISTKPVEPAQPTAGMQALRSSRMVQLRDEVTYPEGIQSPNPSLNVNKKGKVYDLTFLMQFSTVRGPHSDHIRCQSNNVYRYSQRSRR